MHFIQAIWFFIEIVSQKLLSLISRREYIFSFIAGASTSFIQAPYDFWWLLFPSFGLFYYLYAQTNTVKDAFLTGALFTFGYHLIGLYWIGNALLVEGNNYRWAWPLAVAGLPLLLSLISGIYVGIAHILTPNKRSLVGLLSCCALIACAEWVRGYAFTGFPWSLYGYSWGSIQEMRQSVALIGPYGLTFLTILWGCSIGFILLKGAKKAPVIVGLIVSLIITYEYGHFRLFYADNNFDRNTQIHIVQPNIAQEDKWNPNMLGVNFNKHIQHSKIEQRADRNIIIWPETAIPPILLKNPSVQERIQTILTPNTSLIAGALLQKEETYHNAITLWSDGQKDSQHLYSKSHLVPFGEYIPFQNLIPLKTVTNFSELTRGNGTQVLKDQAFLSFLPLICYEIIFPQRHNTPNADYILTLTNDAWYGKSPGPYQHFAQATFRAVETGLPVIRSANTGISGIINSYGNIVIQSQLMQETSISAPLPRFLSKGTYYSTYGDLLFFIMIISALIPAILLKYKQKN